MLFHLPAVAGLTLAGSRACLPSFQSGVKGSLQRSGPGARDRARWGVREAGSSLADPQLQPGNGDCYRQACWSNKLEVALERGLWGGEEGYI